MERLVDFVSRDVHIAATFGRRYDCRSWMQYKNCMLTLNTVTVQHI